jgi:hypothetical protein
LSLFCIFAFSNLYYKYQEVKQLDEKIKLYSENMLVDEVNKEKFNQILDYVTIATSTEEVQLNLPNPFLPKPTEKIISTSTSTEIITPTIN